MPKIGPRTTPVAHMGQLTDQEKLANAEAFLKNIASFRWPDSYPDRPDSLYLDDVQLWQAYRKIERGEKPTREEREQLQLLGEWRSAVCGVEARGFGRLQTCVGVLCTLEGAGRWEDAKLVRQHVWAEFRCRLPEPAQGTPFRETRQFCEHFSRNYALLPKHLRTMTRPPEGAWTKSSSTEGQNVPTLGRTNLPYAEDDE
jgi:hypothetical protein